MKLPPPGQVRYEFRHAIGGFFEFPTEDARRLLPAFLQPVEPHHGQSVLSVMAFDFTGSAVGAYRELVLSVLVAPQLVGGRPLVRAAFYPFVVATTTRASREHAIALWHLPHFMHDIDIEFAVDQHDVRVQATHGGLPILEMAVTDHSWETVEHHYQAFEHDATGSYMTAMSMVGEFSESEEERGALGLHAHPFTAGLDSAGVTPTPFRELWMRNGRQTFEPLETLGTTAR